MFSRSRVDFIAFTHEKLTRKTIELMWDKQATRKFVRVDFYWLEFINIEYNKFSSSFGSGDAKFRNMYLKMCV